MQVEGNTIILTLFINKKKKNYIYILETETEIQFVLVNGNVCIQVSQVRITLRPGYCL